MSKKFSHPWSTTWKKALVSLPRLVPDHALKLTSPDGPHPFVVKLPARDPNKHQIPVYVFLHVPPPHELSSGAVASSAVAASAVASPHSASPLAPPHQKLPFVNTTTSGTEGHSLSLPVLVDFHGGSFILGTPQEQAPFCAQMAREIGSTYLGGGCVVISVDYRLGPYSKYPAANEDAEDVLKAVLEESSEGGNLLRERIRQEVSKMGREEWVNIDKTRIALSGSSSGGNMALTLAMSVKNDPTVGRDWPSVFPGNFPRSIPILLFYPSLDSRLLPDERPRPPGLDAPAGFFTRLKIESELMPKYLPIEQRAHPRASPGLGEVKDGGLHAKARLMLILPELDSLSDQSMTWVKKVEAEGREEDLVVISVKGVMHGWTQFPDSWLKNEEERRKKYEVFQQARVFVQSIWEDGRE
jgi:acetyl esterase/lipase